nr:ATP synthase CF0 B subunit [Elakatothrix viridis]
MFFLTNLVNIPIGEGFGINTNIFETNIINLAAVLGIVISFVGQNLNLLLEDRQKIILNNLKESKNRAFLAQVELSIAKLKLIEAEIKAKKIRQEGIIKAAQEINNCITLQKERLTRLEEFKQESLQFYQQKAFKEASAYLIKKIIDRVKKRLNSGLDSTYHLVVNNFYVSRLTKYNP